MRVAISEKQEELEAQHASSPNGRSAAEHRQDVFAFDQLDLEEEEGAQEDGESVAEDRFGGRRQARSRPDSGRDTCRSRFGLSKYCHFGHNRILARTLAPVEP